MNNLMIFENKQVEVFELNGQVLFNPYHCGQCLELTESAVRNHLANMNSRQAILLRNSDVREKDFRKLNNAGEKFLTESGVYKIIFKSKKEEAEKFQDWVTDEVLPSIRKTGCYNSNKITKERIMAVIETLREDEYKNEAVAGLLKLIPVDESKRLSRRKIVDFTLDIKSILDEFLAKDNVILRKIPYGIAVDRIKLYKYFSKYGLTSYEALRLLDEYKLIYHKPSKARTVQIRISGKSNPIRAVVLIPNYK
ncbi:hypothetical protein CLPUN_35530 [Clostridium puniceum]|uniref:Bro-N domain-containing protein n=1 Tax=Clostridium puniceum TaxID=29367 RepID=A0A1S8TBK4_9CLOT|nr:BRO family protein [Clostridium puniceum]OOM75116.1 hypothetical protein CLPUN_35530 [Clostridium puniceum]